MELMGQAASKGVTRVLLQGGLNPNLPLEYYTDLVRETRRQFPQIHPHFYSAPEIMKMVEVSGLSVREVLLELQKAGLETMPGRRLRDTLKQGEVQVKPALPQG